MRECRFGMRTRILLVLAAISWAHIAIAQSQIRFPSAPALSSDVASTSTCEGDPGHSSFVDPLRPNCRKAAPETGAPDAQKTIVIEFLGGFVKHDDIKHPEVQFAAYLHQRYQSAIHAEVFSNHHARQALQEVLHLLDADGDGSLTFAEKARARIILYGHSWGASQAVAFARRLQQLGIPVLLTIQVDIIGKPGTNSAVIPPNVASAVNFYQVTGLLHGRSQISAADPTRTKILGNFQMTYADRSIDCAKYPWYSRTFTRTHLEIENDPRVWDQVASLIDSEISASSPHQDSSSE
jgi:pimeloyl-ACP methyl ester carboxylesterase